jgi:hypothetical protein
MVKYLEVSNNSCVTTTSCNTAEEALLGHRQLIHSRSRRRSNVLVHREIRSAHEPQLLQGTTKRPNTVQQDKTQSKTTYVLKQQRPQVGLIITGVQHQTSREIHKFNCQPSSSYTG